MSLRTGACLVAPCKVNTATPTNSRDAPTCRSTIRTCGTCPGVRWRAEGMTKCGERGKFGSIAAGSSAAHASKIVGADAVGSHHPHRELSLAHDRNTHENRCTVESLPWRVCVRSLAPSAQGPDGAQLFATRCWPALTLRAQAGHPVVDRLNADLPNPAGPPATTGGSDNATDRRMKALGKNLFYKMLGSERFNKPAIRLYSVFRPPPYQRPNMEFDFDVWNGICTFHSIDGRQIGENNTNPEIYKELASTEHRISAFEGSRQGLPINITALKQVMSVWDDTLQFATLLRNDFIRRRGLDSPRLNLQQGYAFSKLAAAYPAYLARRRRNAIDVLPAVETAFFTVGVGPFMLVRSLMERGDQLAFHEAPLDAAAMYEMADNAGTLVTPAGYGCAGSRRLIVDFLDVMMNGSYQKPLGSVNARRAMDSIGDWDKFHDYVDASSRLELLVKSTRYLCAQWLWALRSDSNALSDIESSWVDRCLAHTSHLPAGGHDDRLVTGRFIAIALALLDEFAASEVRLALVQADLLRTEAEVRQPAPPGIDVRVWAAHQIRMTVKVLFPFCQQELDRTHRALKRFESKSISLDDLYTRCCGPDIPALLGSLEASRRPGAARASK